MRVLLAALLLAGCVSTGPEPITPTPENVARQFEVAAFGNDFGVGQDTMRRWPNEPVVGWVDSEAARTSLALHDAFLKASMDDIAVATGLGWNRSAVRDDQVNFQIAVMPRRQFRQVQPTWVSAGDEINASLCLVHIATQRGNGEVIGALVLIGADISERDQRDCILEEIYQAMGLPADACHYRPSVICEADTVFELTPADRLLLATLYDDRLRPGMDRATAIPIARAIIAERWSEFME